MNLTTRTSITALAALCSVAAIAPGAASASKLVTYDVEVNSSVSYNLTQQTASDGYSWNAATWFDWGQTAKIGQVKFLDGHLIQGATGRGLEQAWGQSDSVTKIRGDRTHSGTCKVDETQRESGPVKVGRPDEVEGPTSTLAVAISDTDVGLKWACTGEIGSWIPSFGSKPIDPEGLFGRRPLDATFEIPPEIVGYGTIIQNVQGPGGPSASYCPEEEADGVTQCRFHWRGDLTFKKTGERTVDAPAPSGPAPAPANPTPPAPKPATPAATSDDEVIELPPLVVPDSQATSDAKATKVSFTAQCPAGCNGTAALTVTGAKASAAAARPVATMRFKGRGGAKPHTVTLKLSARARRALRRARRGTLRVTLRQPGQKAVTRTLRVRAPRR